MHEEQKAVIKVQEKRNEEEHRLEMKILEQKLKDNAKDNPDKTTKGGDLN